ncbi:DEKNAAC104040 [Brettanomyces naardenensis]|uniref:DEKNAAC104040 n=1 Tax=Brettanomyces naardenensis TaxID=13370 RepID=A0A448YPW7_BRENA|nr:DEKNAAC104040 [Brettanomyces naardenensis]
MDLQTNGSSSTYGCGCYDGEGYYPVSPLQDISPCFLNGILLNIISACVILAGFDEIRRLRRKSNIRSRPQVWFPLKLGLISLQILFQIDVVIRTASETTYPSDSITFLDDSVWWSTVATLTAFCVCFLDSYIENYKSFISSPVLLLYWLLYSIIGLFRIINVYLRDTSTLSIYLTVSTFVNGLIILLLETNFSPRVIHLPNERYSRRDYSNIFGRITFSWLSPLMQKGYRKYLILSDLPPLPSQLRAEHLSSVLSKNWSDQLKKKNGSPSLTMAIAHSFGVPFAIGGLFEFSKDCILFIQPQILKRLILFVQSYDADHSISMVRGFMLVLLMFGLSMVGSTCMHQYVERVMDMGIKIKSSLNCLVYQKSIALSIQARQKKSTGDIVNLMSVDTERLRQLCNNLQIVWSGPFQVSLCLISLYRLMGNSMWIGVLVLLITIPLNTLISRKQKALQRAQMKVKDQRTGMTSEILNNIKSLKLYAWERPYKKRLMEVRNDKELKNLMHIGVYQALNQFIFNAAPSFVSSSTFALFLVLYAGVPLTTDIAFTALSLFNLLENPLSQFPEVVSDIVEAQVSLHRLREFLLSDELDFGAVTHLPHDSKESNAVSIRDGNFLWSKQPRKVALTDINFAAKDATLNCIVGRVGSGKSALLHALLGNLYKEGGDVTVRGSIAYVPQVPWLMNGTIKENILFGFKEDPLFYKETFDACALSQDLDALPDGDLTQVGEKGISLSGGQKARLSLARAVYARADIYIMDDILSAVDEHVGKHLIKNVLGPDGILQGRCRILATNNLHVLRFSDQITMLSQGRVIEEGSYEELSGNGAKQNTHLSQLLEEFGTDMDRSQSVSEVSTVQKVDIAQTMAVSDSGTSSPSSSVEPLKVLKNAELEEYREVIRREEQLTAASGRTEKRVQGSVQFGVYLAYMEACGVRNVCMFFFFIVASMGVSVLANFWLKHWSELNGDEGTNPEPWKNLGIYFGFCMCAALFTFLQSLVQWLLCSISGSRIMHQRMLDSVLRAPMEFFETTPIGRILNRFSSDISKVDESLFKVFNNFFGSIVKVAFTILVILISTWQFIFFVVPLSFVYKYFQNYYIATSRELRRLDSITISPVFAHFQETLNGVETIRAYGQVDRFVFLCRRRMNVNLGAYQPAMAANRWLSMRLEFIGSLIILGASGLLIVTLKSGHVTPGLVGLSVSYALQVTQALDRTVRMSSRIESDIVSVERIGEYSSLPSEAPEIVEGNRPEPNWPEKGVVSFKNYSTRYRKDLDLALKDINIAIKSQEKVGIVGRTGAGKSSLTLAIFRIIEATSGHICIDEVNTSTIGLYDLRSRLSIIPQDAQIFQGTIRSNIDPERQFEDSDIWTALKLSHLDLHVKRMYKATADKSKIKYNALFLPLSEGGSNLSVGQRQLMCLARALCKKKSRILVLDEATANVDVQTDSIVQETIRSAFKEKTILTIAHRINTIIDSDRIVVLEDGRVAEFDTPSNLLKDPNSLFYALCDEGGIVKG